MTAQRTHPLLIISAGRSASSSHSSSEWCATTDHLWDSASTEWLLLPLMTHVSASSLWSYHLLRCPRLCPVERHSFTHFFNRAHAHTHTHAHAGGQKLLGPAGVHLQQLFPTVDFHVGTVPLHSGGFLQPQILRARYEWLGRRQSGLELWLVIEMISRNQAQLYYTIL